MKIFFSHSGDVSRAVAMRLQDFIKCVLQGCEPFISSHDIAPGSVWFNVISKNLAQSSVGIICLTKENLNSPWILFESGAIAKGMEESRVCALLIGDLKSSDTTPPLSHFQQTRFDRDGILGLLTNLNAIIESPQLDDDRLKKCFDAFWPSLEEGYKNILASYPRLAVQAPARNERDILAEVLDTVRQVDHRLTRLESRSALDNQRNQDVPRQLINPVHKIERERAALLKLKNEGYSDKEILEFAIGSGFDDKTVTWFFAENASRILRPGSATHAAETDQQKPES